eukprot:2276895-Pleurochrysis_carterae.AAC.1
MRNAVAFTLLAGEQTHLAYATREKEEARERGAGGGFDCRKQWAWRVTGGRRARGGRAGQTR